MSNVSHPPLSAATAQQSQRDDWVEYAKGIGIILVVYGHVARGLRNAGLADSFAQYDLVDNLIYSFHMPLFFFLSGLYFFKSLAGRGSKQFVFSKVDTIVYPYLLWSVVQGGIQVFLSKYTNHQASLSEISKILWAPIDHFWFLYALFVMFVMCTLIFSVVPKAYSFWVFLAAAVYYLFPVQLLGPTISPLISQYWVFFCAGIFLSTRGGFQRIFNAAGLAMTLALFIFSQWYVDSQLHLRFTDMGPFELLLALISIAFIVSVSGILAKFPVKFLAYIGSSSMAIYILHVLAASAIRIILRKVFHIESFAVHAVLGLLGGMVLPLMAVAVFKRFGIKYAFSAPLSRWLAAPLGLAKRPTSP